MTPLTSILVATDFSIDGNNAVRRAALLRIPPFAIGTSVRLNDGRSGVVVAPQRVVTNCHVIQDARVVSIRPYMPDVDNPAFEQYKHMEEVAFRYEKITWKYLDGNIEWTDSWKEGR